ncbi:glycosyltransferase family 2 protein [Dawidia soli]|uniref:Glycosyltransferase n=1 Tax=Dawidia soli TaxID=2782352 RepID=A0AAP2D7J3_9BACT|nr:glycosyltransferase [Dawidia soli]MBT1686724.1 glycosyltransferase [Dawidia soli]
MAAVSVMIPVYNAGKYIGATIESVLHQTFGDWELIVVDDCSTDDTVAVVERYVQQDTRVKLYRNSANLGMMRNWNNGLPYCTGRYFAKLDADDLWHPAMLQTCYTVLEQEASVGMVFSRYRLIDEHGVDLPAVDEPLPAFARNTSFCGVDLVKRGTYGMLADNVMKQGIGLIRRRLFDELGPFSLHDAGDTEMWFRIAAHYRIYGIDAVYYSYRIWPDNFTRTQVLKQGKRDRNLYEVRALILDYYRQQGLITSAEHGAFTRDNQYEYDKSRVYAYRLQGKWPQALATLLTNFLRYPVRTCAFYTTRLRERMASKPKTI